jgi:MFS transporter, DHA1 family, multidrug resistance protein
MSEHFLRGAGVLDGDIRVLLRMQLLMNTSHFMTVPLLALYMSNTLHFGAGRLATVMTINLVSAQALPLFAGLIADSFGSRHLLSAGLWLRAAGLLGFALFHDPLAWAGFALLTGSGVACYEAGLYGTLGRQPKQHAAEVFASNNQMLNLGAIAGPTLGGLAGFFDARVAFAISAALFAVLGAVSTRMSGAGQVHAPSAVSADTPRFHWHPLRAVLTERRFLRLLLVSLPWFFLFPQLYVTFPLYASRIAGPHAAPALYVLNGAVGFAFMVAAKRWLIRSEPVRMMTGAYLAATLAFSSVAWVQGTAWFFVFVAAYTVIETILLPAIETMTARFAHDGSQSTFFGVLSVGSAIGGAAGYYVGSWLALNASAPVMWLTFGAIGASGCALAAMFVAR